MFRVTRARSRRTLIRETAAHRRARKGPIALIAVLLAAVVAAAAGGQGSVEPYETYKTTVAASTPATHYRFDDAASATTLADSAGTRDATVSGITLAANGPMAGASAGSFDGEAFATLPSTPLATATAFSVEAWVKWTGGASYDEKIFDFGSSATSFMSLTPAASATNHPLRFEIRAAETDGFTLDAPTLDAGAWRHVAVTQTSAGVVAIYLNGTEVAQQAGVTLNPSSLGNTSANRLGKSQTATDPGFNGSLSNLALYARALPAAEVRSHYDAAMFPVNQTEPTISGTTRDGETLSVARGDWSGVTPIDYDYQWRRCDSAGAACADVSGATSATYALTPADIGHTLRVTVTAENSAGTRTATSAATAAIAGVAPVNGAAPTLSGSAIDGEPLTGARGSWSGSDPIAYAYQWQRCDAGILSCDEIAGATTLSYAIQAADIGSRLRLEVAAQNVAGQTEALSAPSDEVVAAEPENTTAPVASGTARDGALLSADTGSWKGTTPLDYGYQWRRCDATGAGCSDIAAATASSYRAGAADIGATLRVEVTATNAVGAASATSAATAVVAASAPENTELPAIGGTTEQGETLSASEGSWSGTAPLAYDHQWQRCDGAGTNCADLAGATASTYTVQAADIGNELRVRVRASNAQGSASATSAASNVVVPTGATTCTNVWNGRGATNLWSTAANWSASRVPNSTDRACAGAVQVRVTATASAGSVFFVDTIEVAGATLSLTDPLVPSQAAELKLASSGVQTGAGHLSLSRGLSITGSGAKLAGTGSTTLEAGASGSINTGTWTSYLDQRTLRNRGTLTYARGYVTGTNGARIENSGTLRLNSDLESIGYGAGARPQLRNTGTLVKDSGLGTTSVRFALDNEGVVRSDTGQLAFLGGGVAGETASGSWTASPGASVRLGGGAFAFGADIAMGGRIVMNENASVSAGRIQGADLLELQSATLTLTDPLVPSQAAELKLASSGVQTGAGHLSLSRGLSITGSGAKLAGTGSTTLEAGASGSFNTGTWTSSLDQRTLRNRGTFTYVRGYLQGLNGARIENEGTLRLNSDLEMMGYGAGARPQIRNTGTIVKDSGTGTTRNYYAIDNEGTVRSETGQLTFLGGGVAGETAAGSWTAAPGASLRLGGGAFAFGADIAMGGRIVMNENAAVSAGRVQGADLLELQDATLTLTDTLVPSQAAELKLDTRGVQTGPGHLSLTRALSMVGDDPELAGSGSTTLEEGAIGTINNGSWDSWIDGRRVVNRGTLTYTRGYVIFSNGARLENEGTLRLNADAEMIRYDGVGAKAQLRNTGTITKDAGLGTGRINLALDNEGTVRAETGQLAFGSGGVTGETASGSWTAAPGASVRLAGGTFALGADIAMGGRIVMNGNAIVSAGRVQGADLLELQDGRLTLTDPLATSQAAELKLDTRGIQDGPGHLSLSRALSMIGDDPELAGSGSTTLEEGATGTINNGSWGDAFLSERTLLNRGTLTVISGGITGQNGGVLHNQSTLVLNSETGPLRAANEDAGTLVNDGIATKQAGTGISEVSFAVEGDGHFVEESGTILLTGPWNEDGPHVASSISLTPTISLVGGGTQLFWNGQAPIGIPLEIRADAGISNVKVTDMGGTVLAGEEADCTEGCPEEWDLTLTIPHSVLAPTSEGTTTPLHVVGRTPAGRYATLPLDLIRDQTDPSAPTDLEARMNSEESTVNLDWSPGKDPTLDGGGVGSGATSSRYRLRVNGGAWGEWQSNAVAEGAAVTGASLGDTVTAELSTIDSAGNESTTSTESAYVAEPASAAGDWSAEFEDPLVSAASTDPVSARRKCPFGFKEDAGPRFITSRGETRALISATAEVSCPVTDYRFDYMKLRLSYYKRGGSDNEYHLQKRSEWKRQETAQPPLRLRMDMLCRPGVGDYYAKIEMKVVLSGPLAFDIEDDGRTYKSFDCDEAGAWRWQAQDVKRPSRRLGTNLRKAEDFKPASGFVAHHIITARKRGGLLPGSTVGERAGDRAQKIGYSCAILPNSATNGVWLRGHTLRAGLPAFNRLTDPDLRDRQYHPTLHTDTHLKWVAEMLDNALPNGTDITNCDKGEAEDIVRNIASIEENGNATF